MDQIFWLTIYYFCEKIGKGRRSTIFEILFLFQTDDGIDILYVDCLSFVMCPLLVLQFLLFSLQTLTVLMRQTRQAVHACLWMSMDDGSIHRHLRKKDWLMASTTCLVFLVSTVCGWCKNAIGRGSVSSGHITKLEQSTFL